MCLAQGPQRSDAGEARTRGPSVSSQALILIICYPSETVALAVSPEVLTFQETCNDIYTVWHVNKLAVSLGTDYTV